MRKHHQNQILDLLCTLREAHDEAGRLLSEGQAETVLRLLADCQEVALRIGDFIEQLAGEGTKTVSLLEEYCDSLYRIGTKLGETGKNAPSVKTLQKSLIRIETSVKDELAPDRIEIAFIPYKASMWDALESVWLAAKDDPACDAYVVPVPYYDRLPDGAFGRMHYEGGEYPAYVPIVDYKNYDFEERRPDAIFTHNPYDGGNLVTSVHPDFYGERLKTFTDMLVYIPYFVVVDDVDEHFCVCAGTLYADRVIVQSEKVRKTYVRVFKEFEKKRNCKGRFGKPEDKFLALGSPKFDKVLGTRREDCALPHDWRRCIEKPDGTRKKVVLYNTSIGALLAGNEKYLAKLRRALARFKSRDDVVLWWRPHPLNEATYRSMRPGLLREYEAIVSEYRRAGFGIYDDTADLHRAIAHSDAYYGDGSSVVALYGLTGKPILLQSTAELSESLDEYSIASENLYDDGEYLWFTAMDFNALLRMDKRTWKAEYMGSFPEDRFDKEKICGQIVRNGDKLYFAPFSSKTFYAYDLTRCAFEVLPVRECIRERPNLSFYSVVSYDRYIFCMGYAFNGILRFDTETSETIHFDGWAEEANKLTEGHGGPYFAHASEIDGKLYCPLILTRAVVIFDADTCRWCLHKLRTKSKGHHDIAHDGRHFWLASGSDGAALIKWDAENGAIEEFDNPAGPSDGCLTVCFANERIWYLPCTTNRALKVDIRTNEISVFERFDDEFFFENLDTDWIGHNVIGDTIYLHKNSPTNSSLVAFDAVTSECREERIRLDAEQLAKLEPRLRRAFFERASACEGHLDFLANESIVLNLNNYIDWVTTDKTDESNALRKKQSNLFGTAISNGDGTAGKAVLSAVSEYLKQRV